MPVVLLTIWNFLGGFKGVVTASILGAIFFSGASYVNEYNRLGKAEVSLKRDKTQLEALLATAKANSVVANNTITVLNERIAARADTLQENCKILSDIAKSTEKDAKGPVGSTVGDVLDALGRKKTK